MMYAYIQKMKNTGMVPSLHEFFQGASCPLSVEKTDLMIQMSNSGEGTHNNYNIKSTSIAQARS